MSRTLNIVDGSGAANYPKVPLKNSSYSTAWGDTAAGKKTLETVAILKNTAPSTAQTAVGNMPGLPVAPKKSTTPAKPPPLIAVGDAFAATPPIEVESAHALPDSNARVYFNPPPHSMTKPPKISWQQGATFGKGVEYTRSVSDLSPTAPSGQIRRGRLGALVSQGSDMRGKRWGVSFHYNPTSLSINAASLTGDSLSMETYADQASEMHLLGAGTVTMSLELYFNRIFDVAYPGATYYSGLAQTNVGGWGENQLDMVKRHGTGYDIEYLYRIANGDPEASGGKDRSSDNGFLLWRPAQLIMGPFRYIGVIDNISTNHILFTPDMIPTFTQVTVGFTRIVGGGPTGTLVKSAGPGSSEAWRTKLLESAGDYSTDGGSGSGFDGGGGVAGGGGGGWNEE